MAPLQFYNAKTDKGAISYAEPFLRRMTNCTNRQQLEELMEIFVTTNNLDRETAYYYLMRKLLSTGKFAFLKEKVQDFLLQQSISYIAREIKANRGRLISSFCQKDSQKRTSHPVSDMIVDIIEGATGQELEIKTAIQIHDIVSVLCNNLLKNSIGSKNSASSANV